jgi:hypothetical protein
MLAKDIFNIDMALGHFVSALCIATYVWPRLSWNSNHHQLTSRSTLK